MIVPYFEAHAHAARVHANADIILYGPVVHDVNAWKNFSATHKDWVEESRSIATQLAIDDSGMMSSPGSRGVIEQSFLEILNPGVNALTFASVGSPFLPVVSYSPPLEQYNDFRDLNIFSVPKFGDAAAAAMALQGTSTMNRR